MPCKSWFIIFKNNSLKVRQVWFLSLWKEGAVWWIIAIRSWLDTGGSPTNPLHFKSKKEGPNCLVTLSIPFGRHNCKSNWVPKLKLAQRLPLLCLGVSSYQKTDHNKMVPEGTWIYLENDHLILLKVDKKDIVFKIGRASCRERV